MYIQHSAHLTGPVCSLLGHLYVWLLYAAMAIAEALLTLRVWALYGKSRALTVFLLAVYGGSFAASGAKIYLSLSSLEVMVVPIPGRPDVCFTISYDQQLYLYWVFMIVVDAVSCVMLLIKLAKAYRAGGMTNLMRVVYQDGVIFYLVLLCFSVVNIFSIVMLPTEISSLLTAPERIIHAVLASRVILHTRHQAFTDANLIALYTIPSFDAGHPDQLVSRLPPTSSVVNYPGNYTAPVTPYRPLGPPSSGPQSERPRTTSSCSDDTKVESGGAGPIFEAAAEKQRQRQQAKLKRSLRLSCKNRQYHLPTRGLSQGPSPSDEPEQPPEYEMGDEV